MNRPAQNMFPETAINLNFPQPRTSFRIEFFLGAGGNRMGDLQENAIFFDSEVVIVFKRQTFDVIRTQSKVVRSLCVPL